MPTWKLDLVFEAHGQGWEETYYRNFTGSDFGSAATVASTLATKRIALCGSPVRIKAWRINDPLTPGRQGQANYFQPAYVATHGSGEQGNGAASPSSSINVGFINNAENRSRRISMRGVWDDAITKSGSLEGPQYAAWLAVFNVWRTYVLQQGFGWLKRPRAASDVPVSYSIVNPVMPLFTFPAGTFTDPGDVGTFKLIRFSKFNGSTSTLNRELVVRVLTTATAEAAAPIAAAAMITPGRAIIYGTPAFIVADNVGVERAGRRAPGRPLLLTPGRSRARRRT